MTELGHIFTTEPLATRAVAAELRHDPDITRALFEEVLSTDLPRLTHVNAESSQHENLDIVLFFDQIVIGIEGKIGHFVSEEQISREISTTDHLVMLVKEEDDVPSEFQERVSAVITWERLISEFPDSRITIDDINSVNDNTRIARRILSALSVNTLPASWDSSQSTENGFPALKFRSSNLISAPDRAIIVQLAKSRGDDTYNLSMGITVSDRDFRNVTDRDWVAPVNSFGKFLERRLNGTDFQLSRTPGQGVRGKPSGMKLMQAKEAYLPLRYAQGYANSHIGPRISKIEPSRLQEALDTALPIIVEYTERH